MGDPAGGRAPCDAARRAAGGKGCAEQAAWLVHFAHIQALKTSEEPRLRLLDPFGMSLRDQLRATMIFFTILNSPLLTCNWYTPSARFTPSKKMRVR